MTAFSSLPLIGTEEAEAMTAEYDVRRATSSFSSSSMGVAPPKGYSEVSQPQSTTYTLLPARRLTVPRSRAPQSTEEFLDDIKCNVGDSMVNGNSIGEVYAIDGTKTSDKAKTELRKHAALLGELPSTAICGNDITASCFYVVGELAKSAGGYAPVCTLLAAFTLFCFQKIYGEVVMALPLNGGIYNLLLNSSTKRVASVAACLTILSYVATGVVSSVSAAEYVHTATGSNEFPTTAVATCILAFFALLMLLGMKESSVVATVVFLLHLSTLVLLTGTSLVHIGRHGVQQLWDNWQWERQKPYHISIFYGFSSAMLGVSGFETSANFVEEQQTGVFYRTLTNMWRCVTVINTTFALLTVVILPIDDLAGRHSNHSLAYLAEVVGGSSLRTLVAMDAFVVLAGSVLTSYVGVSGLFIRMAGDRCLPDFFGYVNDWRRTPHWTIITFFSICSSMCVVLNGTAYYQTLEISSWNTRDITLKHPRYLTGRNAREHQREYQREHRREHQRELQGKHQREHQGYRKIAKQTIGNISLLAVMYSLSFLLVMSLFAACGLWMKIKRPTLPRDITSSPVWFFMGLTLVGIAFTAVVWKTPMVLTYFYIYYAATVFVVMLTFSRVAITTVILAAIESGSLPCTSALEDWAHKEIESRQSQGVIFFAKTANLSQLNRVLLYIAANEESRHVRICHCYLHAPQIPPLLIEYVRLLDCVYPNVRIDCVLVRTDDEFGPSTVRVVSELLGVPVNCMFITCPNQHFRHRLDSLGGVRVILNDGSRRRRSTILSIFDDE